MIVGGRSFEWDRDDVENALRGKLPEPIREHVVGVNGTEWPPKQVFATVTGWDRQSFTTLEAQRVLTKIGFDCYRAGTKSLRTAPTQDMSRESRLNHLEATVTTLQEAVASLVRRVAALEIG